ncbi:hypothetical protein KBI52_17825 [Microvirga sp. HBU67558]|uniref:hypothetical protein n=1 Tax=Microvirga TaxID=186650 RepID=UPI001B35CC13|nr:MULTISPECIES: hypothetical protein [unclassified Microvirga]MBQ0822055.1 hypothetical protein [Microvirga sp. HBU67558]
MGDERSHVQGERKEHRAFDPDILPRLRSLLATLVDLDVAHASNLIVIESRPMDEARKDRLTTGLWLSHCRRRAPYVREIEALRERMDATFR